MNLEKETYFGIICERKDEKILVERVNAYLKLLDRTTSKSKNKDLLESHLPFVYKHFYWNLNKSTATWLEIVPNKDEENKWLFTDFFQCNWIMKVIINLETFTDGTQEKAENFIEGLLKEIMFDYLIIKVKN